MPSYLVEIYLASSASGERQEREQQATSAAATLTREGTHVRFGGSIHVPEDEMCLFVFEAPSAPAVALVAARAGLEALRIVEAVSGLPGED